MSSGPFAWTLPAPPPDLPVAELIAESSQFRTFCHLRLEESSTKVAKRDYLRKRGIPHVRREELTDPDKLMRKLAIETGYDIRRDLFLKAPLEPWLCDYPIVAMRAYARIMRDEPGARDLASYDTPAELDAIAYIRDEQLIGTDRNKIVPLSDARPRDQRKFPGAPVPDGLAGYGKRLGPLADELIMEAFARYCAGGARLPPGALLASGVRLVARQFAAEANAIKASRPELDVYRYLSVATCQRHVRDLIEAGRLKELEPPRPVRQGRSWVTIARLFERMAAECSESSRAARRRTNSARSGKAARMRASSRVPRPARTTESSAAGDHRTLRKSRDAMAPP